MPSEIMDYCYQANIQSVIVEGGSQILSSFIEHNLWDEARIFVGNIVFENGIRAPRLPANPRFTSQLSNSILLYNFSDEWAPLANIDYL